MKNISRQVFTFLSFFLLLSIIYTIFDTNVSNSSTFVITDRTPPFYDSIPLGVYIPALGEDNEYLVEEYEQMIGRDVKYVLLFKAWGDLDKEFPMRMVETLSRRDIIPIITWEPWKRDFQHSNLPQKEFTLQSIMNGNHDEYIRDWARKSKSVNSTIIIRFAHEQSTMPATRSWYPWQGEPFDYASAFKHVVKVFREEQAFNVKFMWSPIGMDQSYTYLYYPGDSFVDYIGLSILNHGIQIGEDWERWKSCDELFLNQYKYALRYGHPIIISELGSSEIGGDKSEWLKKCLSQIATSKNIFGVVNIQISKDPTYNGIDWRVNSSQEVLGVYKKSLSIY